MPDVQTTHSWRLDLESVRALAFALHPNPFSVLGPHDSPGGASSAPFYPVH